MRSRQARRRTSQKQVAKKSLFSAISQPMETNSGAQRQQYIPQEELRFLVFGTRSTFGVGLENPRQEAYPYQLSPYTHNAATRQGGFTLAAACTQSIVREDIYDAIILEFMTWDQALTILAQRLRQRFPNAALILLRLWHPSQLKYRYDVPSPNDSTKSTTKTMDFHTYRQRNGQKRGMDDPELYFSILSQKSRWTFEKPKDEPLVLKLAAKYGASYFAMNFPDNELFEYPKTMMDQLSIFQDNINADDGAARDDLNKAGHATVAASLRSIIRSAKIPSPELAEQVHPWAEAEMQDVCRLWFENGLYPPLQLTSKESEGQTNDSSDRFRQVEFNKAGVTSDRFWSTGGSDAENHKHALEVDETTGSTLSIVNPFDKPRMLYLTYLTTYAPWEEDDDDDGTNAEFSISDDSNASSGSPEFSNLRIRINDKPAILIEALHHQAEQKVQSSPPTEGNESNRGNRKLLQEQRKWPEVARTTAVGIVPKGKSIVHLDPVPTTMYKTTRPFRLLGWSLLPQQVVDALELPTIEYSLEESAVLPSTVDWEWLS